jgi:hypothetical protein
LLRAALFSWFLWVVYEWTEERFREVQADWSCVHAQLSMACCQGGLLPCSDPITEVLFSLFLLPSSLY